MRKIPSSVATLSRREALVLLLAGLPGAALLLSGCGGGGGNSGSSPLDNPNQYFALGDSYAYGYTTQAATPTGRGEQGYVRPFADALGQQGGSNFALTNLAIPGETTASFHRASGTPPASSYNTHYSSGTTALSQADLLFQSAATLHAHSREITVATLQIGGNDILSVVTDPTLLPESDADRQARLDAALAALDTSYPAILQMVRAAAPNARIFLIGYPDPFAGLGSANPLQGFSTPIAQGMNAIFQKYAPQFQAKYVDIFTPFVGHETAYTNILTQDPPGSGIPDYHPNATGYSVIAAQLTAAASNVAL